MPEYSLCGDGASRYIAADLSTGSADVFGDKVYPDPDLFSALYKNTEQICRDANVNYHLGQTFSIDTVIAQFAHMDEIIDRGFNAIETEYRRFTRKSIFPSSF